MTEEQEHTAFETWRRSTTKMSPDDAVARDGIGELSEYENRTTRAMWIGWKGRALAALSEPASPARCNPSPGASKADMRPAEAVRSMGATNVTPLPTVTWKTGETRRLTLQEAACLFPDSGWAKEAGIAPLTPPANPAP